MLLHRVWPDGHNVVLTGFMGTGKSTVGRVLADRLGYNFVDTDDLIEAAHGPIPAIFASRGEAEFRELEHDVATRLGASRRTVIATGGRLMLDDRNVTALSRSSRVCCLVASADEIVARVTADAGRRDRPLLQVDDPRRRVEELLAERDDGYRRFLRVSAGGKTPEVVASEIVAAFAEPHRYRDAASTTIVGAGLMTVLSELVGAVGRLEGEAAAWFAPQVEVVSVGNVVTFGDTPLDDAEPDVLVPITDAAVAPPASARVVVNDAAVIQAVAPGCRAWNEIFARLERAAER